MQVLRWIGADLMVAAVCGTVSLIIFGAQGDGRDFMPDWEQNYLSWSFGLAFVGEKNFEDIRYYISAISESPIQSLFPGVAMQYVTSVLFLVEARVQQRKEIARENVEKQQYPMERTV